MRVVNGKSLRDMDRVEMLVWAEQYREIIIDLGTGDGRYVRRLAAQRADCGVIGVDLVTATMQHAARTGESNALFVVADAVALPDDLRQVATRVTINFPWGSLLRGLLAGETGLLRGLSMVGRGGAMLDIMVNAGALAEAGWSLEAGGGQVVAALRAGGVRVGAVSLLTAPELRSQPTTWAKRIAFGRDPRALRIAASLCSAHSERPADVVHSFAGRRLAGLFSCEPFCSVGQVSAQPHHTVSGASPQEGGLVARACTRAPQI